MKTSKREQRDQFNCRQLTELYDGLLADLKAHIFAGGGVTEEYAGRRTWYATRLITESGRIIHHRIHPHDVPGHILRRHIAYGTALEFEPLVTE